MTEEQFGRDQFEYIWRNVHLYCQPDPGNKLVDLDVTNKDDYYEMMLEEEEKEEEEEEDLSENKKLRRERAVD